MKTLLACIGAFAASLPALAADMSVDIEIPRLEVAEYHRPYVAAWIEREDRSVAAQLAAWYQQKATREGDGTKWLPDLRQWWRRGGRSLEMPVDGVTGATRPEGRHALRFAGDDARLAALAPGRYRLVVEAAREVGGRELLDIDFDWPPAQAQRLTAQGQHELGAIVLELNP